MIDLVVSLIREFSIINVYFLKSEYMIEFKI